MHALASEDGEVQWGYGVDVGRAQDELDIGETAADAVERATRMLGAKQPKSQRLTVVLDPRVAASFLSIVGGTLTGERVLKGRSPFADRMGDAIASPMLTLVDDATNPESLGADSHDGEGLATRPNTLINAGTLHDVPAQQLHRSARLDRLDRIGGAGVLVSSGCRLPRAHPLSRAR